MAMQVSEQTKQIPQERTDGDPAGPIADKAGYTEKKSEMI